MDYLYDVVIVGSGPAGVSAAYPLIKKGLKVAIVDGGLEESKVAEKLDDFSAIKLTETSNAYELFKKNSYIFNKTYQLLKIKSNFEVVQTLSKGGFSKFWHGISDFFTDSELQAIGLPISEIQKEYKQLIKLIRIENNLPLDIHNRLILKTSRDKGDIVGLIYKLPSAENYVQKLSIEVFKKFKNFTYIPHQLVDTFKNKSDLVELKTISINDSSKLVIKSSYLILAAGSINSTRITLKSLNLFNYKTTFLTKAHTVMVCFHSKVLFSKKDFKQMRFGQLAISSKEVDLGLSKFFIQLFRFSPTAIEKSTKYIPLPKLLAKSLMRVIAPVLVFADIRFPSIESSDKFCQLKKILNKKDILEIQFKETEEELIDHQKELKKIKKQLKILGLTPLRQGNDYVTSHYAGGIPIQEKPGKISADLNGKLHQAKRVYIADAATWRVLPAKAPTLTIMANALRIGKKILENF